MMVIQILDLYLIQIPPVYYPEIFFFNFRFYEIIPITFLTGFYVTQVVTRYWDQFLSLPWPDRLAYKMVTFFPGKASSTKLKIGNIH